MVAHEFGESSVMGRGAVPWPEPEHIQDDNAKSPSIRSLGTIEPLIAQEFYDLGQ